MTAPEPPPDANELAEKDLDDLRRRIDAVDGRLIAALSERAAIVTEIGRSKRASGYPIYAPHRERQVLARVLAANPGPLTDRTVEAIYRELMSGSFALELPLRVGYLGPRGSFSHVAATRHFGSSVEFDDLHEIDHVFEEVAAARCHYGLVPYENSIGGGITDTLDAFQQHKVTIYAESMIEVRQTLLANCLPNEVERIYSKPQVFSQCRRWLSKHYPEAELLPTLSSSRAVQQAADEPAAAAIGSELAGEIYGVKPLFQQIQDKPNNITRFLIIGREEARPTGDDKTTIMFVTAHKPGALVDVLAVFRDASINLSHIDKRPSGRTNWEYTFFIDCDQHQEDATMATAIEEARSHCLTLQVLGSYPRVGAVI
ncbi:MAG: prephenate dehydratase [Phycisphaerales bacterium]|nr:prephenate dehydratase [Phycisphaerales bacterium]NNM24598.1 prephenate dehydratase [Phycisphaerales bacterium]